MVLCGKFLGNLVVILGNYNEASFQMKEYTFCDMVMHDTHVCVVSWKFGSFIGSDNEALFGPI